MKKNPNPFSSIINIHQILIGFIVLLSGSQVYVIDRSPDKIYFMQKSFVNISLHNALPNLFGFIGNCLPSFVHVFSFILITAGLMHCRVKGYLIICTFWLLTDAIFEIGQKYTILFLKLIPDWFQHIPYLENTENYFLRGTFDHFDLAAILAGSLTGYLVLIWTPFKGDHEDEQRI